MDSVYAEASNKEHCADTKYPFCYMMVTIIDKARAMLQN